MLSSGSSEAASETCLRWSFIRTSMHECTTKFGLGPGRYARLLVHVQKSVYRLKGYRWSSAASQWSTTGNGSGIV